MFLPPVEVRAELFTAFLLRRYSVLQRCDFGLAPRWGEHGAVQPDEVARGTELATVPFPGAVIRLLFDDLQTMAVGIAGQKSFGKTEISLGRGGDAGRNDASAVAT